MVVLLPLKIDNGALLMNRSSIGKELVSGLRLHHGRQAALSLILMAAMANLFVFPYTYTFMPIFARNILGTNAGGFGQLVAGAGLGAIIGALVVGFLPQSANRGRILVGTILAWPFALMSLSFSKSFQLSMALLIMAGMAQGISMALLQALLLIRSTEECAAEYPAPVPLLLVPSHWDFLERL